jgi:hypothetical protein
MSPIYLVESMVLYTWLKWKKTEARATIQPINVEQNSELATVTLNVPMTFTGSMEKPTSQVAKVHLGTLVAAVQRWTFGKLTRFLQLTLLTLAPIVDSTDAKALTVVITVLGKDTKVYVTKTDVM